VEETEAGLQILAGAGRDETVDRVRKRSASERVLARELTDRHLSSGAFGEGWHWVCFLAVDAETPGSKRGRAHLRQRAKGVPSRSFVLLVAFAARWCCYRHFASTPFGRARRGAEASPCVPDSPSRAFLTRPVSFSRILVTVLSNLWPGVLWTTS
jgi:hypothetical protein